MKPRYVQAVAVLLWGIQTDFLLFALPMAILLEGRYFLNRRWALTKQDFYRIADLTGIGLTGLLVYLFLNARELHFITTLIELLPIVSFPLVVVLAYSTSERMTLDVMFYSLRRQKEPVQQSWDMDYLFIGICLLATATNVSWHVYYLPVAAAIICWSLFPVRSRRYEPGIWILVASTIFLSAHFTQQGIKGAHEALKEQSARWIANFLRNRIDPMKTSASLGNMGDLKLSDTIVFRVEGIDGDRVPALLQEASYDLLSGTAWLAMSPAFETVPHTDDFLWRLGEPDAGDQDVNIYLEFDRERSLVPVPSGVSVIRDLPARDVRISQYGSVQGAGLVPSPLYRVSYNATDNLNREPELSDLYIPDEYERLMKEVTGGVSFARRWQAVDFVRRFFADFRYSLYQDNKNAGNDPLGNFLLYSRKGHCEYFASAATMLLRQLGVPARYVVGYSVQEYHPVIGMYVVRERHAHAWSIAFFDGRWQVVDTTPAIWAAEEKRASSSLLRPAQDYMANMLFIFQLWWNDQRLEDYQIELFIIGAILTIILIWRMYTSEQVILTREEDDENIPAHAQGMDSPFFMIEHALVEAGFARGKGELVGRWLTRIGKTELMPMLRLHNKWRFDPRGIDSADKRKLEVQVNEWLATIESGESVKAEKQSSG